MLLGRVLLLRPGPGVENPGTGVPPGRVLLLRPGPGVENPGRGVPTGRVRARAGTGGGVGRDLVSVFGLEMLLRLLLL